MLPRNYVLMIESLPELCLCFFLDSTISVFHLGASHGQGLKLYGMDSKGKTAFVPGHLLFSFFIRNSYFD